MILNVILVATAVIVGLRLLSPKMRHSKSWQATVTPLASIIGSGFLVVLPLLGHEIGNWAVLGMGGIVLLAYGIGIILRFNIEYAEPVLARTHPPGLLRVTEGLADISLGIAYTISVTFYIRLLAAFLLRGVGMAEAELPARIVATAVLLLIGAVGIWRGLDGLEKLEEYAVSIKIAIIATLIVGLLYFNVQSWAAGTPLTPIPISTDWWRTVRILAGMLLVVQGFETSRYLGEKYDPALRIKTMRWAQLISGVIYIVFVGLATILLTDLPPQIDDTAIIDLVKYIAPVLPSMLVIAALMSQFSAAVADTVGSGGLVLELFGKRISQTQSYVLIIGLAIVLTWAANIFQVITLASRAFALYYLLETVIAWGTAYHLLQGRERLVMMGKTAVMAVFLLFVVIFAVPAG
ncbi:hypothetical protein MNBD_CHLOROFLEXI01-133 [hydrothermal vent metagenome]|uniref:Uncharacterized protein n=1 Tax=hydrothermal vent metagenome TaxID=652676 RepID=A0A3B0V8A4_9ZZZZ